MSIKLFKLFLITLIFLPFIFLYYFNFKFSFIYHPDIARDLNDIIDIAKGDLTLIGPKLSFFGLYAGPYYYYLFLPVFLISHFNPFSLLFFNVFLFLFSLWNFFYHIYQKENLTKAIFSTYFIALSYLFLTQSRNPWNGSTYLPLLFIYLTSIYYQPKLNFILGLLAGIIIQFHPITLLVFLPLLLFFRLHQKNIGKSQNFKYLSGIIVSLFPVFIFEQKNKFIISQSILNAFKFSSESTISLSLNKFNFINNLSIIDFPYLLSLILAIYFLIKKTHVYLSLSLIFSLVLTLIANYFQFGPHYFFPFQLLSLFFLSVTLLKSKSFFVLIILILFNLASFPSKIYQTSTRPIASYQNTTNEIINQNILHKERPFNALYISSDYGLKIVNANEYQFLFKKAGFKISDFSKNQISDTLILISDDINFNIENFSCWELDQFNEKHNKQFMIKEIQNENKKIYYLKAN